MLKFKQNKNTKKSILSYDFINTLKEKYEKNININNNICIIANSIRQNGINNTCKNSKILSNFIYEFSNKTKIECKATDQKNSGRCWIFSATNVIRQKLIQEYNLPNDFELSQCYLFFWDKLERANYFIESIIKTKKELLDSRLVMHLLHEPIQDGGQWDMLVNLIKKYGLVPKTIYPETHCSCNSKMLNNILNKLLRGFAYKIREFEYHGSKEEMKKEMMEDIYRILCMHLGEPPQQFEWKYTDKNGNFNRYENITPLEFYKNHIKSFYDVDEKICIIHIPEPYKLSNQLYTIKYLGNVVEGYPIRYINIKDINIMKKAIIDSIKDNEAIWFGCDVGKYFDPKSGILDINLYQYDQCYQTDMENVLNNKGLRMAYGESQMTHAMIFTGVDIKENKNYIQWKVENSWSERVGNKGYLLMSDIWFNEFVYEIVVDKKYLPKEIVNILLNQEPIELKPWDPCGALA